VFSSCGNLCSPRTGHDRVEESRPASPTRESYNSGTQIISSPKSYSNSFSVLKSVASAMALSGMSLRSTRMTFNGVPRLRSSAVQF
jgi:hypothetical protein